MTKRETKVYKGILKAMDAELSKPILYDNPSTNSAQRPVLMAPNRVKQLADALTNFTTSVRNKHMVTAGQPYFGPDVEY